MSFFASSARTSRLFYLAYGLFLQYIVITFTLMYFYQGGYYFDHEATSFIINRNYLSDLGRTISFNGQTNPAYLFYTLTLSLAGLGVSLFFLLISSTLSSRWKYLLLFFALISSVGYIGIAFNPVDSSLQAHLIFGKLSFFAFFFASVLAHILLDRTQYRRASQIFYLLNFLLFLYLLLMFFGPRSSSGLWALALKTLAQKFIVYTMMISALFILGDLRKQKKPPKATF